MKGYSSPNFNYFMTLASKTQAPFIVFPSRLFCLYKVIRLWSIESLTMRIDIFNKMTKKSLLVQLDQSHSHGCQYSLGTVGLFHLLKHVFGVSSDCLFTYAQFRCDLFIRIG